MDVLLYKTRLSVIACRYIVPHFYRGETVRLPEIAKKIGFNPRSVNPAFAALTKAGILRSLVGGAHGSRGYIFAKDPKEVTLYDLVEAIEGEQTVGCCSATLKCQPNRCCKCSIHAELEKVVSLRKEILSSTTIYKHYKLMTEREALNK